MENSNENDDDEKKKKNGNNSKVHSSGNQLKYAFAGGLSGALTRAICQPLDMIKIRFQLQVEPLNYLSNLKTTTTAKTTTSSKYTSMHQATKLIIKEEGIKALWKGHNPAQILSIIYGISQFYCYEQLKIKSNDYQFLLNHSSLTNFLCGGIGGAVGTFASSPLDVVRTRLIAQDNKCGYNNSFQGLRKIVKIEGVSGLYRGIVPALIQVTPLTGANFMFYKLFCEILQKFMGYTTEKEIPALGLMLTGGLAGVASKTLIYPMDLTKKRLQIQGFGDHRKTYGAHFKCEGLIDCMVSTVRREGFLGLYKGLWPSMLKAGSTTALHFAFYAEICRVIIKD